MKINLLIILFFGTTGLCCGQNLNMVILVNEELVISEIAGAYLNFENADGTKSRSSVGYYPGELTLHLEDWVKINSESTKKINLTFDYYTYKGSEQLIGNFGIELQKSHFEKRYLILRVYDFRDRKFKRLYGCLTTKDFVAELNFPQGGTLIRCE